MSTDSPPARFNGPPSSVPQRSTLNSRMIVAAIAVFFVVVFLLLALNMYAKCFWRRSRQRSARPWRRRHQLDFAAAAAGDSSAAAHRPSIGLDKSILESLPVFSYKLPSNDEEPLLECAVCLCEFQENEQGRLLPSCNHSFHTACIDMWFHSHTTCPLCRTVVSPSEPTSPSKTPETAVDVDSDRSSSSPALLLRHGPDSEQQLVAPTADSVVSPFPLSLPYPNGFLLRDSSHGSSDQLSFPGMEPGGSSSTRSLSQVSIEIPKGLDSSTASRCMSSSSFSRCPSVDIDRGSSSTQPLKSPSLRRSIKRLLSRERSRGSSRISPAAGNEWGDEQEGPELALRVNAEVPAP